ncbi:MAG: hypothetical protein UZ01_00047 [Candidatus Brocadia sinica]|nr:MAG: hypothetical protein UZ01_00047 [Candidatus Brocadia sinica]
MRKFSRRILDLFFTMVAAHIPYAVSQMTF